MRIIHLKSGGLLSEEERKRLEGIFYPNTEGAIAELKVVFPNHTIKSQDGHLRVTNKDGCINAALFKEETVEDNWVQTNFGFRSIGEKTQKTNAPF